MILHIAPDYVNRPLYKLLIESIQMQNNAPDQLVYACDNSIHEDQQFENNVHIVNRNFSALQRVLFFPKQNYLLKDIADRIAIPKVDLIHAHTLFSSGYLAYRLHQQYHIPYIVAIRNTDVNVFFKWMPHLRSIGRKVAENAEQIIFISPAYKQQVIGRYLPKEVEKKSLVIPNGIDSLFLENKSKHTPSSTKIKLIYIGRIEKAKNIDTIIRVVDLLREAGHDAQLCLIGKIINDYYSIEIAKRDHIEWHDQCSHKEIIHYLKQNDIFIMPSYTETFGLVYAEAMSQGLPVIYTKGQGFDGFFEDGFVGYCTEPNNVEYMLQKILEIQRNYTELSSHCMESASIFNWSSIADKYRKIYDSILIKNT